MTASERIREARNLTQNQTTAQIVEAFTLTDALLDQNITTDQRLAVCETRGWMIDELAKRNQAHLIGLDAR